MNKRIGRFSISYHLLDLPTNVISSVFRGLLVLRVDDNTREECLTYTAIGDVFDEVASGDGIPEYTAVATKRHYGPMNIVNYSVKFARLNSSVHEETIQEMLSRINTQLLFDNAECKTSTIRH